VKLLLALKADPFIKCIKKLSAEDVTTNEELRIILRKGKMFQVTNLWGGNQKRMGEFQKEALEYFQEKAMETVNARSSALMSKGMVKSNFRMGIEKVK
jgi:hypothetical protein